MVPPDIAGRVLFFGPGIGDRDLADLQRKTRPTVRSYGLYVNTLIAVSAPACPSSAILPAG